MYHLKRPADSSKNPNITGDAIISKSQMQCGSYPPAIPVNASSRETSHTCGKVVVGIDKNVYLIIDDVRQHQDQAQNGGIGSRLDGTSGTPRATQDGQPAANPPLV
jgi:hypothetical protein